MTKKNTNQTERVKRINNNRCKDCTTSDTDFNYEVADTGLCGKCLYVKECTDDELLRLYRSNSLSDDLIYYYLPRLRCSHIGNDAPIDDLALRRQIKIVAELTNRAPADQESESPLFTVANEVLINYFRQDDEISSFISHIIDDLDTGEAYQITMQRLKNRSAIESYNKEKNRIEVLENTLAELYLLIKDKDISTKEQCESLIRRALLDGK